MTYDEYAANCENTESVSRANYEALIRLCIALDVDWVTKSYKECYEKVVASMYDILEECETAEANGEDPHAVLARRYARLWMGRKGEKMEFVRAAYGHKVWWKYIIPRRLTLKCNPPIYRWLWWNFCSEATLATGSVARVTTEDCDSDLGTENQK